jgi:hypothetical protein
MLAVIISRVKEAEQIHEVVPHLIDEELSVLQYADNTIIIMDNDLDRAKNMKLLLCTFEQLLGLKINFHKSKLFCYGAAKANRIEYTQIFGCNVGSFPFKYLRILMHHRKLLNKDWKHVEERFQKRILLEE